ncbi:YopX family protein [Bacillus cereus]|uniref:YopX family protein n=1 Tax=Bacillus cereus group TaxID=86661 RepID=UPI00397B753B
MREIKVRAFDKVAEKMYDVGYIDFANEVVQVAMNKGGICYGTYVRRLKDVVLLQYTGLKDKNGKEIYEGDILEFSGNVVALGIVKYNENFATFQACNGNSGWLFGNESGTSIEISGNIYENPELVKN